MVDTRDLPEFPADDSFGEPLIRALGSFWYHYFGDRVPMQTLFRAQGNIAGQTYIDFLEAVATVSRFDIPVFHEENWFLLVLKDSDRGLVKNVYDQGLQYDEGGYQYDQPQVAEILYPLPTHSFFGELADIPFELFNRVIAPSKTWTRGVDFDINFTRNLIRFREDPFESDLVARRDIFDDTTGELIDQEIGLWVYKGQWDKEFIYKHFAFAVGIQEKSSEFYKGVMNAAWDNHVIGPNFQSMQQLIAAMLGIPLVIEPRETVEQIVEEPERTLVITDKNSYAFVPTAGIVVSEGDVLVGGDSMSDGVLVRDLSGSNWDISALPAAALGEKFLSGGYFGELVFENKTVAVEYLGTDDDNKAVVRFEVQGFPFDVDLFFDQSQANAKELNKKTLAELLDIRENPIGQPLPQDLPTNLNPLEFVLDNIMRNHVWLVRVRASAIDPRAPGLQIFRFLRDVVPPHTTVIIYIEINPTADTMDLSVSGDDETPGVEEATERFNGVLIEDEFTEVSDIVVSVHKVSEVCE